MACKDRFMTDIEFEAKTDRELLLLTAQQVNRLTQGFPELCARVSALEQTDREMKLSNKHKTVIWSAIITGMIALVLGVVDAFKR